MILRPPGAPRRGNAECRYALITENGGVARPSVLRDARCAGSSGRRCWLSSFKLRHVEERRQAHLERRTLLQRQRSISAIAPAGALILPSWMMKANTS